MKFLIISDTHGDIEKAAEIYRSLPETDAVIHLGDLEEDARGLSRLLAADVISVKGNMDNGYKKEDAFKTIDTECGKLLLTHGHMQNVKSSLTSLMYLAEEQNCIAALFGHTHIPVCENVNGLYLINPGSLTYPAAAAMPSYALVTTAADGIAAEIRYYGEGKENEKYCKDDKDKKNPQKPAGSVPKVQGGFLRNLLNNSDRF